MTTTKFPEITWGPEPTPTSELGDHLIAEAKKKPGEWGTVEVDNVGAAASLRAYVMKPRGMTARTTNTGKKAEGKPRVKFMYQVPPKVEAEPQTPAEALTEAVTSTEPKAAAKPKFASMAKEKADD